MSDRGVGPRRIKVSARRIAYRLADCIAWIKTREQAS
jgi:hypothetical protein